MERYIYPLWLEHEAQQPYELQPSQEVEKARSELAQVEAMAAETQARLAKVRAELFALS